MAKHDSKDATDDVLDAVDATELTTGSTAEELGASDSRAPKHGFFVRLYTGTGAFDVVGKRKLWFGISGAIVAIAILSILVRGFTFGIDFEGGTKVSLPAAGAQGQVTTQQVEDVFSKTFGKAPESVVQVGNGGSASIANHLQCDHVKGIRGTTNAHNRVFSLSTNVELFSAIANDLGYDSVFEYQLQSLARPGDVLVAISSSGRSASIVRALDWAEANGVRTIALTGFDGEPSRSRATVSIHVEAVNYGIVEDAHQSCMHLLAQYLRQSWMTPDAVASEVF